MSRRDIAIVAGITFLVYIAVGLSRMAFGGQPGVIAFLSMITSICALVLGVTLFALTRSEDETLALLAMALRIVEGVPGVQGEFYFAAGSLLFAWLFLRGRMIPAALAWLGVVASVLLVLLIPMQTLDLFGAATDWGRGATFLVWLPMLVFEVVLAVWLIAKGVSDPARTRPARSENVVVPPEV